MRLMTAKHGLGSRPGASWAWLLAVAGLAGLAGFALVGVSLRVSRTASLPGIDARPEQAALAPATATAEGAPLSGASTSRQILEGGGAPETAALAAAGEPDGTDQDEGGIRLRVPFRSQWDGSTYEWGNCGVSAITMAMEYFGHTYSTHAVRESINVMTGNWNTKIGVDWRYLKAALERRDFAVAGPYNARGGYLQWTLADLVAQVEQGRPPILLVHYRSLPGHEEDEWFGDHYIVFLGLTGDGRVVYHDPGFPGQDGAYLTIDQEQFERAWSNTWIGQNRTAMVVLGSG